MKSLIFLVDENRNQLSALERAISSVEEFELAGMTSDGEECIRQLEGKHVHVLVLDMILPKKDGFYVLEKYAAEGCRWIILSAYPHISVK